MTDVYTPPANSTLASQGAPVAVVADNDVVSLSVSYGPFRATETVWQQGAFCPLYMRSTRTDARTFTIVRDDGWPSKPLVWVNDPPGAVAGPALLAVDPTAVAQWSLDGTLADRSGNGRDMNGTTDYSGDIILGHLGARNGIILSPASEVPFQITGDMTVMFRHWSASPGARQFLCGSILGTASAGPWGLETDSAQKFCYRSQGGVLVTSNVSAPKYFAWYCFRRASSIVKLQIDATTYVSTAVAVPAAPGLMRINGDSGTPTQGAMYDLNIWARALSDSEIAARRSIMMGL